jgi:elongation factor 1 alpha-like protein
VPFRSIGAAPLTCCQGLQQQRSTALGCHSSLAAFFADMPWLSVPKDGQAVFLEPSLPKGGLLGGSGAVPKVSKLQALAAARRRKAEESKSEQAANSPKLSMKMALREGRPQSEAAAGLTSTEQNLGTDRAKSASQAQVQESSLAQSILSDKHLARSSRLTLETPAATPSAFAQALLGSTCEGSPDQQTNAYSIPYPTLKPGLVLSAFSGPSPDDIVLAAQSQGSLFSKKTAPTPKSQEH